MLIDGRRHMWDYKVEWESQSKDSSESMPFGGGDIGGNVWVEQNQVFLYLQQSGWFDENNSLLKAGRFCIQIESNPFEKNFKQSLILKEGRVEILGLDFKMNLWVDVKAPVVHIEYDSKSEKEIVVTYETWRFDDREVDHCSYELFQCKEMFYYPLANPIFHKDQVVQEENQLFFYHQNDNQDLSIEKEFDDQGLREYYDASYNPQKNLVCGGILRGTDLVFNGISKGEYIDTPFHAFSYRTARKKCSGNITIALSAVKTEKWETLKEDLEQLLCDKESTLESDRFEQAKWWANYLEQSYIEGNQNQTEYAEIFQNYTLFHFMMGCNYYGDWPTKFNGGLFTFDPSKGGKSPWRDDPLKYTPDYRLWGGGSHTIQNQRLLYWPMLKNGEYDVIKQHFNFFNRTLPIAKKRCEKCFHIDGAMYPEQVGTYGLCCGCDNEWGNRSGLPVSQIKYHFSNSLETAFMILEYHRFSGIDISEYMDFIKSIVLFYHHFYAQNDENGKMVIYPGNALETYHVVKNPIDAIAGIKTVVENLLALPDEYFSSEEKELFHKIQQRIPEMKVRNKNGHMILAYADHTSEIHNCEIPELYTVFPYGQYGLGKKDLDLGIRTARYAADTEEQMTHISWHPTGIQYARLGMLDECESFLKKKMKNGAFRFPAFWGPGHDWTPDHNWGGSGMIQLQEMLLQTDNKEIRLLPCWNPKIDVHFQLYAPYETKIECSYRECTIEYLRVEPEERRKDVIFPEWVDRK